MKPQDWISTKFLLFASLVKKMFIFKAVLSTPALRNFCFNRDFGRLQSKSAQQLDLIFYLLHTSTHNNP